MRYETRYAIAILGAILLAGAPPRADDSPAFDPAAPDALAKLQTWGQVDIDAARDSGDGNGALRIAPGARAILPLRDTDGAGRVTFKVFDDGAAPADPKKRHAGPHWGVINADGRALAAGAIYAPYLSGATTYAAAAYAPGKKGGNFLSAVQYLAVKRTPEWHEWTFDFDPAKGVRILYDGKDVNAKRQRFNWAKANVQGFTGIVLIGDAAKTEGQTLWVDAIRADLSGAALAPPPTPTPRPPVTPESDPAPERQLRLVDAVQGRHPRLLFGPDDIETLRAKSKTQPAASFFNEMTRYAADAKAPAQPKFLTNATDAQRQALWRLPSVALHYVVTRNPQSLQNAETFLQLFLRLPHWENGKEQDSGMGAANIATGAALAYDMLYEDLDPAFRKQFARKLLLQARRQFYHGHKKGGPGPHYWQSDPQNNHRYHRDSGLFLATLAVADELPEAQWLLAKVAQEAAFIHKWLPEDGTCHESPTYQTFGLSYLVMALTASDRCLGTEYIKHPYFRNTPRFQLHSFTPDFNQLFAYGDSNIAGASGYTIAVLACARAARLADEQAGLLALRKARPKAFFPAWMGFLWSDPALAPGSLHNIPTFQFYPDMGIVHARESWKPGAAAMMFKCGPYGGHLLNQFRRENNGAYINVAHDDPDANSFLLATPRGMVVLPDGYSKKKTTASHNTILIDGKGQKGEGKGWTQPLKGVDMAKLANIVAVRTGEGGRSVAEGEAGGMYDALATWRRAVAWMPGDYVLVVDRIVAKNGTPEIAWLVQSKQVAPASAPNQFRLTADAASVDLNFASSVPVQSRIADSPAADKKGPLGLRQLRLAAQTDQWVSAAVFDVWDKNARPALKPTPNGATVTVNGPHGADTWQYDFSNPNAPFLKSVARDGNALNWKQTK